MVNLHIWWFVPISCWINVSIFNRSPIPRKACPFRQLDSFVRNMARLDTDLLILMVVFHSYLHLPEGISHSPFWLVQSLWISGISHFQSHSPFFLLGKNHPRKFPPGASHGFSSPGYNLTELELSGALSYIQQGEVPFGPLAKHGEAAAAHLARLVHRPHEL